MGHARRVNTASQDLAHHLGVLQQRLEHPTDYELALYYFLEEFAGDVQFMNECDVEDGLGLVVVLNQIAAKALGQPVSVNEPKVFRLAEFSFCHGRAFLPNRVVLFFYFESLNTGLAAIMPGVTGGTEVARFRLPAGLANPKRN
jgi:hypothetical protein